MFNIRRATMADLEFLIQVDRQDEAFTHWVRTEQQEVERRTWIMGFVTSPSMAAWIAEEAATGRTSGTIMVLFRDRLHETPTEANLALFRSLDERIFPPDGRFCEVFDLWVDPACRRQGLGTHLKRVAEAESILRGIRMIYTHTEERNQHVIELNRKIGYHEVRRGPFEDDVIHVSLVKWLDQQDSKRR